MARRTRFLVVGLLFAAIAIALAIVALEKPFDPGVFEFGVVKEFEGTIHEDPIPVLATVPVGTNQGSASTEYLLVSPGKWSASRWIEGFDGKYVSLKGSLIYQGGNTMIEIVPGSLRPVEANGEPGSDLSWVALGAQELAGEIVDAKCFLGVMKPGREKTHRSCAARCISGGIPPMLLTTTTEGDEALYLLLDARGNLINDRILDYVGEPVAMTGEVQQQGSYLYLFVEPESIQRISK